MNAAAAVRVGPWADALAASRHEVSVLTSREGAAGGKNPSVVASRFGTPSNRAGLAKRFWQEVRLGRDICLSLGGLNPKPDLVVITSPPFFMACLCAKTVRRLKLPYVLDVRDRYPEVLFDLGLVSQKGFIGKFLKRMDTLR